MSSIEVRLIEPGSIVRSRLLSIDDLSEIMRIRLQSKPLLQGLSFESEKHNGRWEEDYREIDTTEAPDIAHYYPLEPEKLHELVKAVSTFVTTGAAVTFVKEAKNTIIEWLKIREGREMIIETPDFKLTFKGAKAFDEAERFLEQLKRSRP